MPLDDHGQHPPRPPSAEGPRPRAEIAGVVEQPPHPEPREHHPVRRRMPDRCQESPHHIPPRLAAYFAAKPLSERAQGLRSCRVISHDCQEVREFGSLGKGVRARVIVLVDEMEAAPLAHREDDVLIQGLVLNTRQTSSVAPTRIRSASNRVTTIPSSSATRTVRASTSRRSPPGRTSPSSPPFGSSVPHVAGVFHFR